MAPVASSYGSLPFSRHGSAFGQARQGVLREPASGWIGYGNRVNISSSAAMMVSPSSLIDRTNSPRFSFATETISSGCGTTDCPLIRKPGLSLGLVIFPREDLLAFRLSCFAGVCGFHCFLQ
jgi:hypothetical protein